MALTVVAQHRVPRHLQRLLAVDVDKRRVELRVVDADQPRLVKVVPSGDDKVGLKGGRLARHGLGHDRLVVGAVAAPVAEDQEARVARGAGKAPHDALADHGHGQAEF